MSYLAIDMDAMKVLFKARDIRSACLISALFHEDVTHCIFPIERHEFSGKGNNIRNVRLPGFLTTMEQRLLYKNLTGEESNGKYNIGQLMDKLHELLVAIPEDERSLFSLEKAAGSSELAVDHMDAKNWTPPPFIAKLPPSAPSIPSAPSAPSAPWNAPSPGIPSAPSAPSPPRAPTAPKAPPSAPKPGGATARVWAIAEQFWMADENARSDIKAFRKKVVDACEAEGLNGGTAATQFGAWKRSKGL